METRSTDRPGTHSWFLLTADELYGSTRFAFFSCLPHTVFRMAHHAVEYYLKAGLANFLLDREMRALGHELPSLYVSFKERLSPPDDYSQLIEYFDLFERLRYPRADTFSHHILGLPFEEFFSRFSPELQRTVSCFCLPDFDRLVASLRATAIRGEDLEMIVVSEDHASILYKENSSFARPAV